LFIQEHWCSPRGLDKTTYLGLKQPYYGSNQELNSHNGGHQQSPPNNDRVSKKLLEETKTPVIPQLEHNDHNHANVTSHNICVHTAATSLIRVEGNVTIVILPLEDVANLTINLLHKGVRLGVLQILT